MWPGVSLLLMVKCKRKGDKLKEDMLSKKEPALDDLGGSQSIRLQRMLEFENSLLRAGKKKQLSMCDSATHCLDPFSSDLSLFHPCVWI